MSDFTPYEPIVPARISKIVFTVYSEMKEDRDPVTGEGLGTYTETESLQAEAIVVSEDGTPVESHMTTNPSVLVNNNILTTQQLTTIQDWIRAIRANAESSLLPAP